MHENRFSVWKPWQKRNELQKYLTGEGIQTLIHYPIPPHKQGAYIEMEHLNLPTSEQIHKEVLSLPIGPAISSLDAAQVSNVINGFFNFS